jgi:hypothetical protein
LILVIEEKKIWSVQRYRDLLLLAWRRRRKSSCLCVFYDTVEGPRARAEVEEEEEEELLIE